MQLLRAIGALGRNDDDVIGERAQRPAVARAEREHLAPAASRRLGRAEHVRRVAARRVDDQQIARPRQRLDLAREDVIEAEIVAAAVRSDVSVVSAIAGYARRSRM